MQFALPNVLWLLALLPLAAWLLWRAARRRQRLMAAFVSARLLDSLTAGVSHARRRLRAFGLLGALACLIVALARPQWGFQWEEVKQRGLDIIVAIDTSRSMLAEDIKPNRLERAKLAAMDLAAQARSDRVGLIAFAGSAFLQCPLTLDEEAFRQSVKILDTEVIPQGGTALAEAINVARASFTNSDSHKILVLLTDGEDHGEDALDAAAGAAKEGLKVFAIGIGTPDGEVLRLLDARGRSAPLKDEQGNSIHSRLNERILRQIAQATGGAYLRLSGARTVEQLYEQRLSLLPKTDYAARLVRQYHERYHWPLALAILLLVGEILLPDRRMKTNGTRPDLSARRARAAALVLLLALPCSLRAVSASDAERFMRDGMFKSARDTYRKLLEKSPNDPRLHYNLGVAAYQARDFATAAGAFDAATLSPENLDLQQRAWYNGGNTLYRLGDAATKFEEKKAHWQSATNHYATALRLDPQDADARFNLDFVTRKLQELEQQQQQQQDQQNQPDQEKDDQQKKEDQQSQDQQKNESQPQEQKEPKAGNQEEKKEPQQAQNQEQKPGEEQPGQQQAGQNKPEDQQGRNDQQAGQEGLPAFQMSPEQARQLLEAAKVEEKVLPFSALVEPPPPKSNRAIKNW